MRYKMTKYVKVQIDLDKETLYRLMLMAHEHNVTLNKLCNNILKKMMKEKKL